MSRINPIRHDPYKCGCDNHAPNAFSRIKRSKREPQQGTILSSRDDGTLFAHNDVTFVGQEVTRA